VSRRAAAALAAVVLGLVLAAVPISHVAACDCALVDLPDAVRQADVAFVGRLAAHRRGGDNFGFPALGEWIWSVERSRDAGTAPSVTVVAETDDGGNCGVVFGTGERWLVVASRHDGALQTNGCLPNVRMENASPETRAVIAELVTAEVDTNKPAPSSIPSPVLIIGGAAAVIALAGVLAFRRHPGR
jgi:hypothetical protein